MFSWCKLKKTYYIEYADCRGSSVVYNTMVKAYDTTQAIQIAKKEAQKTYSKIGWIIKIEEVGGENK